jgi:phytoene dehydrogenase-like protein
VTRHDAVVIGAGPNGLVAGNVLADAGWSVLVVEEQADVGGAVRSDREVHPDFVHDTFSAFYPLGVGSPTIRAMGLEDHGLRWCHAPAVLGHPTPDGAWALLHRDREDTARSLDEAHPGDGEVWLSLCATWDRVGDQLVGALFAPFPPVRGGARLLPAIARAGGLELLRTMALPATDLARRFRGPGGGLLLAGNAGHADIPLTAPGSGLFAILLTMLGQTLGYPAPEGGAGRLTAAMADRLRAKGGEIRCDAAVTSVLVEDGRAYGVVTADGERHLASRAVVADVSAPVLFQRLLPAEVLPQRLADELADFQLDPSTVKVDWALDGPVPWASPPPVAPGTVHVADDVTQMSAVTAEVAAGAIPAVPFLLMGQMTTTDPTRSPTGTESLWGYTHVPQPGATVTDLGDGSIRGVWDHDDCERFADRMQARVERLAPGFGDRVVARRVLGPHELEARNRSLVGGAVNGGTAQAHQQLIFRPVPAMRGRPTTGITGLYLGSSSAHPGGGVHGAPGNNAARAALRHDRLRRTAGILQLRALRSG